jgi:hypothetical protein
MSNATNIASVSVFIELLFMLYVMIPWQYYNVSIFTLIVLFFDLPSAPC